MGGAASLLVQTEQISVDAFRAVAGDKFYQEIFDLFKNDEGFISQSILLDLTYVNSRVPDFGGRAVAVYKKQNLQPIPVAAAQDLLKDVGLSQTLPTLTDGVVSFLDLFKIVKDKIGEVDAAVWDTFSVFDTYRRGYIDATQIKIAYEKLKIQPITLKNAAALAKSADVDKNNRIDIYEFQNTILPALSVAVRQNSEILAQKAREDLAALEKFRMLDTDKNGVVSADELRAVCLRLGYSLEGAIDTTDDMMRATDANRDDKLTLAEIKA
eukprot:gene26011-34613_t